MTEENKHLGEMINTFDAAAGEALGKRESHTPRIEAPKAVKADETLELKVSVQDHPKKLEHSIRWIEVYFREDGRAFNPIMLARVDFTPVSSEPEAEAEGEAIQVRFEHGHGVLQRSRPMVCKRGYKGAVITLRKILFTTPFCP